MKISAIIPCHPRNLPTLPRTLDSIEKASRGLDVETLVINDPDSRGLSWARNEGLRKASGEAVFFIDADDAVKPAYFSRLTDTLDSTGADFVLSSFDYSPLKRAYNILGNEAIREVMLPAFFGYSFDDVRRWNAGGDLHSLREQGSVCRCAFKRDFLERHNIRFDENLRLYEDSPFLAECACYAEKTASIPDILYEYVPGANGIIATQANSKRYYDYKFAALENRKAIAARAGGGIMKYFEASIVFSALELLMARKGFFRYASDPVVAKAIKSFPKSVRHPLAGIAVGVCEVLSKMARSRK